MGIPVRFEPTKDTPRALAALASVAFHLVIYIAVVFFGGRHDGGGTSDTRAMQMVMVEADNVDKTEGVELPPGVGGREARPAGGERPRPRADSRAARRRLPPADSQPRP